ncbi:MAG: hypothetical protein AAB797_02180 [Patescibacteria group bacterium]
MLVILDKLNFYLYKFWMFLRPRRKLGLVSFVILASLVVAVWFVGTDAAHAIEFVEGIKNWIIGLILTVAGWFIKLTFFILKFVIEVAGYNGFIDSPAVTVGWVMVRDVTNMFFVVVLLIISFGTILGLEQYEYKKLLVKLLMAAVIVNFSRIICGIIIDVAQVVMITFVNGVAATASGNLVGMFKIDKIFALTGGADGIAKEGSSFLAAVAAITFSAIMMMTMLTFLFLLMARMMALWILIVLSPFAFVLNVLPQTQKYAGQWWSEFGGNVVAGPIIAFFLWLSFVTVGAGNAHDTIRDNNALSDQNLIDKGTNDPQEENTGITDIMSWAQMANFAIAIGMLLAGAKMAQQLGAAGGAMMGKAGEFGKKVAMIASGATAARWAARGIGEGAKKAGKWGLMNVPLVGGKSWQRRGRDIASWAKYKTIKKGWFGLPSRESRLIAAGKRIETAFGEAGKGKPFSRAWAKMGLWIAPTAFKEEYTKDKEARAKYAEEQMEHLVSTSKTPIGIEKTRAEAELIKLKATGQEIKARKIQDVLEKMSETEKLVMKAREEGKSWEEVEASGKYTDADIFNVKRSENSIQSTAKAKQIEGKLAAEKQVRELEAIRALLQTDVGKKRGEEATAVKATLEQLTFDYEQVKARLVAAARDEVLVGQNRFSEANNYQNTLNTQAEERMKKHSGAGDFVQSVAKTEAQLKRIQTQKEKLAGVVKAGNEDEIKKEQGVLNVLEKSLSEMQISNLGVHAAVADANKARILEKAGMGKEQSMDITPEAIRQLQAQDLSELINDKVEATKEGLAKAMGRFVEMHGKEMAGAILEQKRLRNEKAAGQGSLGRAGLYKLKDKGDGTFETVLVDADSSTDRNSVVSRRTAGLSGFKITSALGLSGSMDRNSAGKAIIKSGGSKEILVKVVGGITANQLGSVDEYTKGDLAEILDNSDLNDVQEILANLKEKVADQRGLKGLLTFVLEKDRMKDSAKIEEVKKLVEELGKSQGKSKK